MDKIDPRDEKLKKDLKKLFADWRRVLPLANKKNFSEDGALPGYFDQNFKILSIGRESHSETHDLIGLVEYFLSNHDMTELNRKFRKKGAKKNNLRCWRLFARTAYGLLQGEENWNAIPKKEDLEGPFRDRKFSFAVMNVSKYANPEGSDPSDDFFYYVSASTWNNKFGRNFTREEIDLLNPDLIIAWNLSRPPWQGLLEQLTDPLRTGLCYPSERYSSERKPVSIWTYKSSRGREIPLINTYHFSRPGKNTENCAARYYYNPIKNAVKKLIKQGKLKVKKGCAFSHL